MLYSDVFAVVASPRSRNSGLKRVASGSGLRVFKQGGLSRLAILGAARWPDGLWLLVASFVAALP